MHTAQVRELTGDMSLTKTEIQATQMLVTTPEKWDVVTRKPGDTSLAALVRLLIIDEVCCPPPPITLMVSRFVFYLKRVIKSTENIIVNYSLMHLYQS